MPLKSPELIVESASAWRKWLAKNYTSAPHIWLVFARSNIRSAGEGSQGYLRTPTLPEALDEALCYGWIDSGGGRRDEYTYYCRFGPRKTRSAWSVKNIGNVTRLEAKGKMCKAGREVLEEAKKNGMWAAAYSSDPPTDLVQAIDAAGKEVQARWEEMGQGERYKWYVKLGGLARPSALREKRISVLLAQLGYVPADATKASKVPIKEVKDGMSRTRRRKINIAPETVDEVEEVEADVVETSSRRASKRRKR